MSTFQQQLKGWAIRLSAKQQSVFVGIVTEAARSIVEGSELTGAMGQPVDTGNLRASWITRFLSPQEALISTNVEYAPYVEDNVNNVVFKNHGPHSVKQTIGGMPRIQAAIARRFA